MSEKLNELVRGYAADLAELDSDIKAIKATLKPLLESRRDVLSRLCESARKAREWDGQRDLPLGEEG